MDDYKFNSPVERPPLLDGIIRYRFRCPKAFNIESVRFYASLNQIILYGHRPLFGENLIKRCTANIIGMPFNPDPDTAPQKKIKHTGVAIECRINAEDPANNFAPCPGTIEKYVPPGGPGVRVDTHVHQGCTISTKYDSMIAKVIVHQKTRTEAIATMRRALREFIIEPIKTTIPACLEILSHNLFVKNKVDTGFVERNL